MICVAVMSLAGSRTLCYPIVSMFFLFVLFFILFKSHVFFCFFISKIMLECNNQSTSDIPTKPCWASYTHSRTYLQFRHSFRPLKRGKKINSYNRYFSCFSFTFLNGGGGATIGLPWICIFKLVHAEPKIQPERQCGEEWKWSVFYHCTHFENIPNSYWFFKDK